MNERNLYNRLLKKNEIYWFKQYKILDISYFMHALSNRKGYLFCSMFILIIMRNFLNTFFFFIQCVLFYTYSKLFYSFVC